MINLYIIIITTLFMSYGCQDSEEEPISFEPLPQMLAPGSEYVGEPASNWSQIRTQIGSVAWTERGYHGKNAMIAILDNGFSGLDRAKGRTLPPSLNVETNATGMVTDTIHGTKLTEIIWGLTAGNDLWNQGQKGPELRLYNTSGAYLNLEKAINDLISYKRQNPSKMVISLYSQIWESGGNADGSGYINALVDKAIRAGILWINAAGNLGKSTWFGPIEFNGKRAKFPDGDKLKVIVTESSRVKFSLGWNDFRESYYYRTSKDLNLVVTDLNGSEIGRSQLIQDGRDRGDQSGYSRHAREYLYATLQPGTYYVKVLARNPEAFVDTDKMWVTANGPGVSIVKGNGDNIVFMPADNPEALTVGALEINYGNSKKDYNGKIIKPELISLSRIEYNNGMVLEGTSTAAAFAAGAIALLSDELGMIHRVKLKSLISRGILGERIEKGVPVLKLPPPDTLSDSR